MSSNETKNKVTYLYDVQQIGKWPTTFKLDKDEKQMIPITTIFVRKNLKTDCTQK